MGIQPLNIIGITGMDNVSGGGISEGVLSPGLIINALPQKTGRLLRRPGYDLVIELENAHSLWSGKNGTFVAGNGKLYSINLTSLTKTELGSIEGPSRRLYYVEVGDRVYISNKYWCKCYEDGSLRTWGDLVENIENYTWVRETNGSKWFLANPDGSPSSVPRPTEFIHAPKGMDYIVGAFGRIWGARENILFYSDALSPEFFQDDVNRFEFNDNILMIAKSSNGLFIGFEKETIFLGGKNPSKMTYNPISIGALENTIQYFSGLSSEVDEVPCWATPSGLVQGSINGQITKLDRGLLRYNVGEMIGSGFVYLETEPTYIISMTMPHQLNNADPSTHEWVTELN